MTRLATAFFLSLLFLLPRGNDHLYTHACHQRIGCPTTTLFKKQEQASISFLKNSQPQIRKSALSDAEDNPVNATDEVEDDDDCIPSRKCVQISHYFLALLYNQVYGDSHRHFKDRLPVCKHFSYTASSKYILQRVIRI